MKKINWFGSNKSGPIFKPVKLPTKTRVRKIKRKNLTWPQAVKKYPKVTMFGDADRDGKLNMFDCKPFDKKKHGWIRQGPNKGKYKVHSLRPYKEAYMKKVYPADTQSNMSYGRDTGYFGTGIYGFKSKRLAKKNQVIPSKIKDKWDAHSQGARTIRSFNVEKPLILDKEQSRILHDKSKTLNKMYYGQYKYGDNEKDRELSRMILASNLQGAGVRNVSEKDIKKAIRKNNKKGLSKQDQPITRLLKAKGYGGVIPHDDYQNFGYGSVVHIDPEGIEPQPLTNKEIREKDILRKARKENKEYNIKLEAERVAKHRPERVYSVDEDGTRVEEGFLDSDDDEIKEALEAYDMEDYDEKD